MTTYFVDTSALAKRYIFEAGSQWVQRWILPQAGHIIVIAELTTVEMFSLIARREQEGTLALTNALTLRTNFLYHTQHEYLTIPLESTVLTHSRNLVTIHPIRTLDAIQLACALHTAFLLQETIVFVSADNKLLSAAQSEGLIADNPLLHP